MSAPDFDAEFRVKLLELIAWRRDVREFRTEPLPDGLFERLVEFACLAPSVGLSQPWRFVLVTEPARRAAVERLAGRLKAAVDFGQVDELMSGGVAAFIADITKQCEQIHKALYSSYITYGAETVL